MRSLSLLLSFIFITGNILAQSQTGWETSKDAENGQKVYRGQFTFEDLKAEKTFDWLQKGADSYRPGAASLKYLQKNLQAYKLVIVLGTWCSDSHDMIPRLYKIMQLCKYPNTNYEMYGVNRAKESLYAESKLYHIKNVPTIIVFKDNFEIGRITETVHESVEADLKAIIEKDHPSNP